MFKEEALNKREGRGWGRSVGCHCFPSIILFQTVVLFPRHNSRCGRKERGKGGEGESACLCERVCVCERDTVRESYYSQRSESYHYAFANIF